MKLLPLALAKYKWGDRYEVGVVGNKVGGGGGRKTKKEKEKEKSLENLHCFHLKQPN